MNRVVPSQDSTPESFARLLKRLTRSPGSPSPVLDPVADEFAVSVSISREGAATLNGSPKRATAPVRVRKPTEGRMPSEASEISYEQALRIHARPRAAEVPALTAPPSADKGTAPRPTKESRAQTEAKALSALRQVRDRAAANRGEPSKTAAAPGNPGRAVPSPGASSVDTNAERNAAPRARAQRVKSGSPRARSGTEPGQTPPRAAAGQPLYARSGRKAMQTSAAEGRLHASPSSAAAPSTAGKAPASSRRRQGLRAEADLSDLEMAPSRTTPSNTLGLEVASHPPALAQRQSIVSIRLNTIEAEQLRQRAAESGISVSAYMRSCVLEAEHLRSQVKQALAELRASHPLTMTPQLEPPQTPLFSALHGSTHPPVDHEGTVMRPGVFGFLSGVFAIVLGRFHR